ncbi:ABC transporter substrate-binding protein [Alkalicoccobacillus porphyridii]|uniref:Iron-siderophore ABC transporter substrate-binding protein n=1 Tax=Alkalicoccobacillus porphyridii TaxID=2597270 RepID=A0A554A0P1_9BACI|nr:iron-siderophore ABC transporter substrate-binding protein [Alkalicoccobacillus porphyridii]TSB47260.1 iron-siderophore ABC transporter substrate-binding protein [Alkalicoccobacillus porphyridii]
MGWRKGFGLVGAVTASLTIVAGCGETSNSNESTNTDENDQEVRTFEHTRGTADIIGVPERVVVLEWGYVEDFLALGIEPVGIADIEGMNTWVDIGMEIPDGVEDIGMRNTPNLEMILALEPDLIIGLESNVESNYEELNDIAPTLVYDPYPAEGEGTQYDVMIETFNEIATIMDKEQEAQEVLDGIDQLFAESKQKIEDAGKAGEEFVVAMAYSDQNAVTFRLHDDTSMAAPMIEEMGLVNAFQSSQFERYGFTSADVEALPAIEDANFFTIIQESDDVIGNHLTGNPIWDGLTFVEEDRIYSLGGDAWPYGGPLSAQIYAEKVVDAFLNE